MTISQWLAMGGYGVYVWSAYVITLLVFLFNIVFVFYQRKSVIAKVQHYYAFILQPMGSISPENKPIEFSANESQAL